MARYCWAGSRLKQQPASCKGRAQFRRTVFPPSCLGARKNGGWKLERPGQSHDDDKPLLTPKQEAFVLAYIETGNASEAHRLAGYGPNMSAKTRNEAASRLLANSKVQAMLRQIQSEHRRRHTITVDDLLDEYDENRTEAFRTSQMAAANGATKGKARLLGYDKGDAPMDGVATKAVPMSQAELARRIAVMIERGDFVGNG